MKEAEVQNAILVELNKNILSQQIIDMKEKFWEKENLKKQIGLPLSNFFNKDSEKNKSAAPGNLEAFSELQLSKIEEQERVRKVLQTRLMLTDSQKISRPIQEDLNEQEISHLVKILNRHINYETEFLTNKNLVQLSKGSL